ncbi:MAG: DUF4349 domain-containing protein [Firmicutes bacterium]|nr:DUF4349 domain-containing protein [Bacillota bacterium]
MKRQRIWLIGLLILIMSFVGCSSGSKNSTREDYAPGGNYNHKVDYDNYEAMPADMEMPSDSKPGSESPLLQGAKIIYSARIGVETTDFAASMQAVESLVKELGGYFENSNTQKSGAYSHATMVIRVPAEQYQTFMDRSGEVGQVYSSSQGITDVTESYYDLENRIETAKIKLKRLQDLMKEATEIIDLIELENAISDVEYQIDYLTGNLKSYDSKISYSTITMELNEVSILRGVEKPPVTFGERISQAWKDGCENAVEGLQDFSVGLAEHWLRWTLILAAIIIFIAVIVRAARGGSRRSRPARQQNQVKPQAPVDKPAEAPAQEAAPKEEPKA